jgi:rhodanese-related sulfurtransferase
MRSLLVTMLLGIAPPAACKKADKAPTLEATSDVPTVTVDELDKNLASWKAVDANGETTRKKLGVIPDAVLLSDYEKYDPAELGADKAKPLVFYCANRQCGASHDAAAKARTAGYTNVKVLPDGIAGWVKAGKQTATI